MKTPLTFIEKGRILRVAVMGLLVWSSTINLGLQAQDKKVFTHTADLRSGKEDALLDIFKPISEQFISEYRALGTAYTTGEVLYHQKRYDDAIRNFETVISRSKKYPFLMNAARLREAQTYLMNDEPATALIAARDVAATPNKFLGAEAWYTLSRAYLATGKVDRAEDSYKNILTVNPIYANMLKIDL